MTPEERTALVERWNQAMHSIAKVMEQIVEAVIDVFRAISEFMRQMGYTIPRVAPAAKWPGTRSIRRRDNRRI